MNKIPYITRLKVKNYRSLADVDVTLSPLTVFIGKNGTGKSNLIDVLRFVRDALNSGFDSALLKRGGYGALLSWFADEGEEIRIELCFEGAESKGEYGFAFASNNGDDYVIKRERLLLQQKNAPKLLLEAVDGQLTRFPSEELDISLGNAAKKPRYKKTPFLSELALASERIDTVRQFLAKMSFYNISPNNLRTPQKVGSAFPLREDGANLGTTLRELKAAKQDDFIVEPLHVATKGLDGYSIEQLGSFLITKLHYTYHNGRVRKASGDLSQESEGTIRLLSILTALYQERFPAPLTIEEPEKAIYPDALAVCGDVFEEAIYRYQVLVTTHSLDLITYLPANTLYVVAKEDGETKVGPLSKNQYNTIRENLFEPDELIEYMDALRVESWPITA